jgi:hypothetical protein
MLGDGIHIVFMPVMALVRVKMRSVEQVEEFEFQDFERAMI